MSTADIARSLSEAKRTIGPDPLQAIKTDTGVTATTMSGLQTTVVDGEGHVATTDMPVELGGAGAAPTPGTLLRSAIASCEATSLAMVAAEEGITLNRVEVTVDSRSDYRGLLGISDHGHSVVPCPREVVIRYRVAAPGVDAERIRNLIARSEARSPVTSALQRVVPVRAEVDLAPDRGADR